MAPVGLITPVRLRQLLELEAPLRRLAVECQENVVGEFSATADVCRTPVSSILGFPGTRQPTGVGAP